MQREQWQVMRSFADAIVRIVVIGRCPDDRDILPEPKATSIQYAASIAEGLAFLRDTPFDALLAVFPLSECTPDQLLDHARRIDSSVVCWVRDPTAQLADAVRLLKRGADHV